MTNYGPQPGSGSGISSITAGTGLSGGTITSSGTIALIPSALIFQGFLGGCGITVASTTSFTVASGQAMSDDNSTMIYLNSGLTKTTGGTWVAGNNQHGLDTGTIANATWYHVFLIYDPTSQTADVLFSTSATSPTLPSGYTKQRRIGSLLTDSSVHFITYLQNGSRFDWAVPLNNAVGVVGVTTATTVTLTVPTGVAVEAILSGAFEDSTGNGLFYLSSLAQTDETPNTAFLTGQSNPANTIVVWSARVVTNTSGQVRSRMSTTTGQATINTSGWMDRRGQG